MMDDIETEYALKLATQAIENLVLVLGRMRGGLINIDGATVDRAIIDGQAALTVCGLSSCGNQKQAAQAGKAYFIHRYPLQG